MSNVRFIGCLHLGHKNLAHWRGFQDEYYMNEAIVEGWNKVVNKKDITYILGDVTMETSEFYYELDRLNGRKVVVLGNHDRYQDIPELLKYVDSVAGMIDYKEFALTHCPIHPSEISFYQGNIHAHIHHTNTLHEVVVPDRYLPVEDYSDAAMPTLHKYFNVDAKLLNYRPILLSEIIERLAGE